MSKSLSIVGKSPGFEKYLEKEGAHVWCVSSVFKQMEQGRVTCIFNLHKPEAFENWMPEEAGRVVTAHPGKVVNYRYFPANDLLNKYGQVFGSSISWMIAAAIEQGYEEINIFGCDMATQTEYMEQRDTFFYWIGRAEAVGVKVNIPETSRAFFKDRVYWKERRENQSS